ncbi:hypothetical protein BKA67DRAFT_545547 [Truncatella angustata]|uniref:Rhodopsin domain-containing protein n=1 Tax=Truncatella angustata TaxID=152316 RepID=A0A9P8UWP4_9PEZI|nr:uncharacterized protein BKA67DRAFT_545547 [Truncatella angustata]KAH6659727.1 hypothetical protein BKA67DRAFT_545547 [Truncatella angustata]KAH8194840.1 hypothetical protein TruAng_010993 [Truncatella angustata]
MAVIQMQTIWSRQETVAAVDKPSNAPTILAVVGTMMGLSTLCTLLRVYVRGFMIKHFGLDDVVMVFAWLAAVGAMVCLVGETHHGAGRHSFDIQLEEWGKLSYWQYIHGPLLVSGISLVKVSLGLFLLRFVQGKWYKRFIIFMIVFILLFTLSCDLTLALQCIPPYASYMFPRPPDAKCFSTDTFLKLSTFNGVMNILTDAVFVLLPVPVIVGLQVNKRVKATLIFILSLGLFACVASIVRVYVGSHVFEDMDYTWAYAFFIWNYAELHTGIIAACLPALRPLFSSILENTSRRLRATGYMYGSSRYGNKYGSKTNPRSGYQRQDDEGVGLESLQRNNRLEEGTYKARIMTTNGTNVSHGEDDSSEDGILPPHGVVKTTEIVVTEGRSKF